MITSLLALLLAVDPLPDSLAQLDQEVGQDLTCLVLLGFAQGMAESGGNFARIPSDLDPRGLKWSEVVVADVMEQTGLSGEEVVENAKELAGREAKNTGAGDETVEERQARIDSCIIRMDAGLASAV